MNEQTLDPQSEIATEVQVESPPTAVHDVIKPLDETSGDFDFWEDLKDSLPPWMNEVVGFALIVFGILSFISLYIASDALVAVTWADMLTALFGNGAIFVAAAIFAFGVVLWLPKVGVNVRFSSARMLALEIVFLSILGLLHLGNTDSELRALARAGQGGGLIGWGLSYPVFWILGRPLALAFFSVLIGICVVIIVGLRRRHIALTFGRFSGKLQLFSERVMHSPRTLPEDDAQTIYQRLVESPDYRTQIMRIRPNPESLPDEVRAIRQAAATNESAVARVRSGKASRSDKMKGASAKAPDHVPTADVSNGNAIDGREAATDRPHDPHSAGNMCTVQGVEVWADSLPSADCLTAAVLIMPDEEEIHHNAKLIQHTLLEFDLETTVIDVQVGPTVTRYALQPHKEDGSDRIRMSKIASYARDLSLALSAKRLRMETPVPGTNYMGIEVPNKEPSVVALRNVMESEEYRDEQRKKRAPLLIPLGRNVTGKPVSLDLAQMPHLLIAGTTGSGKSVCMAAIATSLLMQHRPDELQVVMLDPKMVELSRFNDIPHLLGPVEIDHERIIGVLRWCTREMDRRYKLLEEHGARNIKLYNEAQLAKGGAGKPLPYMVILVDEIGDLMLSNPDETERALTRLAQMARAVGMHMVIATQRPSVDVITGLIKANFPARIAFSVASGADSRVILDRAGAENLLGKGDMLFLSSDADGPQRIQGCFVSEDDVRVVVEHWKQERANRVEGGLIAAKRAGPWEGGLKRRQFFTDTDPMLEDVLKLVVESGEASASLIQRRLGLGYPRAARIMDLLEDLGVVGEEQAGGRSREITIPQGEDPLKYVLDRYMKENPSS